MRTSGSTARSIEGVLTVAALLLVVWFYHWTISANQGFDDQGDVDYYRLLVRGWKKGQLALEKQPTPEMLALADPYDPAQNSAHRLGDASYYRGKYYLYFGAGPALALMLPYDLVTGREMGTGVAVFWFCVIAFLAASGLWLAIRRRYFPRSALVLAPVGVLALGFGTHLLALAQRAAFWELPIAAGIAFTLLALAGVYRAIHGSRPCVAMALAGGCLGLAVASRPTCLFAAPMLLAPLWLAGTRRDPGQSWWRMALAATIPLGLCGLAMMVHNYARFENPLEFGQHYQLSGAYEGKLVHFSPRFVAHNIAVYFFQPLKWTWAFPFASAQGIAANIPGYFGTEEVCGLAVTFVFGWFALGVPLAFVERSREEASRLAATLGGIVGYLGPVAVLLLSYFSTTARYQAELAVAFGLLAACGMLGFERAVQLRRRGAIAVTLATVLCLGTVGMGVLVSLDYHGRALGRTRPQLWAQFDQRAQATLGQVGLWFGIFDGPRVLKVRFQARPRGTIETFWRATDPRAEERIVVEHTGDQLIRFGFVRGAASVQWGRLLKWETNHTHTVEVQLPSLYGPPRGWWSGLRRHIDFRERSSGAVWFSGGRALNAVVDPLPGEIMPGGTMGGDFSGKLRATRTRLFRDDEISDDPRGRVDEPRGGTLRLRVVLPDSLVPDGEPLFATGAHYGSDIVFVRPANGGFKVVFEHYGSPRVESVVLPLVRGPQTVEIRLPSCQRGEPPFGAYSTGDVTVRVNGTEVLRTRQACTGFSPGNEEIGRNPFGTTCAPEFRGWILDARWMAEDG